MHQEKNLERFANATEKFLNVKIQNIEIQNIKIQNIKIQNIKIQKSPWRGIEPRSPAWQAGILTTILQKLTDSENSSYKFYNKNF